MFSPFCRVLQRTFDPTGLQQPVKLKVALDYISDKFGGQLPIRVNREAFEAESDADALDPNEQEVSLPLIPKKLPTFHVLRVMAEQLGKGRGTYVVRRDFVEITTKKHGCEDQVALPVFCPRGSLVALAEGLSHPNKLHVVDCASGEQVASLSLHPEALEAFGFTPDGELLYFFAAEKEKPLFTVWSTRTKHVVRTFKEIGLPGQYDPFQFAPDGKTVLNHSSNGVDLIDLHTGESRRFFDFAASRGVHEETPEPRYFLFSPDNRTLVGMALEAWFIWDIPGCKLRARRKLANQEEVWPPAFISADSRILITEDGTHGFKAWSLETGERLWPANPPTPVVIEDPPNPAGVLDVQREVVGGLGMVYPRSTPDRRFLVVRKDGRIDLLDPATGALHARLSLGDRFDERSDIKFTPDGRWMLSRWHFRQDREPWFVEKWLGKWWPFYEPSGCVVVTDVATGRTALRLTDYGASYQLADDGRTLLSVFAADGEKPAVICCWDVPGRPARSLVVGIPLAVAGAALMLRWWLGRKRKPLPLRREPTPAPLLH
jgi:hypothetical protein